MLGESDVIAKYIENLFSVMEWETPLESEIRLAPHPPTP